MKTDWRLHLRAGLRLGLRLDEVWRLTPGELAFLTGGSAAAVPFARMRFEALSAEFPDEGKTDD